MSGDVNWWITIYSYTPRTAELSSHLAVHPSHIARDTSHVAHRTTRIAHRTSHIAHSTSLIARCTSRITHLASHINTQGTATDRSDVDLLVQTNGTPANRNRMFHINYTACIHFLIYSLHSCISTTQSTSHFMPCSNLRQFGFKSMLTVQILKKINTYKHALWLTDIKLLWS